MVTETKVASKARFRAHSLHRWLIGASLPRYGYDGINADAVWISRNYPHASWVAGYDTGGWPWTAQDWALFPNAVRVQIVTYAGANEGDVLDVENGDATPGQTEAWISMRKAAGYHRPTIYCSASNVPAVRAGTGKWVLNVDYDLWVADWTGKPFQYRCSDGKLCAATQYASGSNADYDVAYDAAWPHRTVPAPPAPPKPVPPVVVPQKRVVSTGTVSLGSAAKYYGVTVEGIVNASLAIENPTNRAALLKYLSAGLMPAGLVYWTSATTRVVSNGSVTLAGAAKFHNVDERVVIASSFAEENPVNRAKFVNYISDGVMPKGLVYWVPSHTA
jgi:hypothetical protein